MFEQLLFAFASFFQELSAEGVASLHLNKHHTFQHQRDLFVMP